MRWQLVWLLVPWALACGGSDQAKPRGVVAGSAGTAGAASDDPQPAPSCGELPVERAPFGCALAWGTNGNRSDRASYLDFISTWVGYETGGGLGTDVCDGCKLAHTLTGQNAMAVYYAYF